MMNFGPEWMRNASSQSKHPVAGGFADGERPPVAAALERGPGSDSGNHLAGTGAVDGPSSLKYSHEMMLQLYRPSDVADGFIVNGIVFSKEPLEPVCTKELSEKEHEVLAGPINSGSTKRYTNTTSASSSGHHHQSGRQHSSVNYNPRNSSIVRSTSNGMHAASRMRVRDGGTRSSVNRLHGAASDAVAGEELAFGGAPHFLGTHDSDALDNSLWAHQSIARSSIGTFGADGVFRAGGDDDGGESLESHPQNKAADGDATFSTKSNTSGGDMAGVSGGNWTWSKVAGGPGAAATILQQQTSQLQDHQLVERAEQLKWWYRDPQGELQGPFTTSHMQEWHVLGYFPADLQVCHDGGTGFQLLSSMVSGLDNAQNPFLLSALAFVSNSRSPLSGISTPATPAALSRTASSLRMPPGDGESAPSRSSIHAASMASAALAPESLLTPLQPEALPSSVAAVDSFKAPSMHVSQTLAANDLDGSDQASQAMQLTALLGEQYMLVNTIRDQQMFAMRLQEQHQQSLAKLMQDLTQESNAIHYRAQIDPASVQPEALFALQQHAQNAEARLQFEYSQLTKASTQEIARLEANIDPVIKDIMMRDGAAYAMSFINQRLQELNAQIANENASKSGHSLQAQNGAGEHSMVDSSAISKKVSNASSVVDVESVSKADIANIQEGLEQLTVSNDKSEDTVEAPAADKTVPKTQEGKPVLKENTKPRAESGSRPQNRDAEEADTLSGSAISTRDDAVNKPTSPLGTEPASADAKGKSKNKGAKASGQSNTTAASFAGPAAPWSTNVSGATGNKPKKTLLQIQQEEEAAMKKRQLAEDTKRAQALSANTFFVTNGVSTSYAGRLGSANTAGVASVSGSSGTPVAGGGSTSFSLAAIMEEQSKESTKAPLSAGGASAAIKSNQATIASRTSAAAGPSSSQAPPVFSWAKTGAAPVTSLPSTTTSTSGATGTSTTSTKKQAAARPLGGQKQHDNGASALPSMEFLEWCFSRLTSLRGIDVCKFIEVLLTFPPQVPGSALEIISEQIYAYSQSLNGHDFAEDFAKRRRKDYSSTRLEKWYGNYSEQERQKLKAEVHRTVASRDQKHQSNFVEFHNHRIIYRRYAGLFFCFCVDTNDNELAYLEAIHLFVEILDSYHGNVCELDLVFNFYMVYSVLDEIILAGEIQETSRSVILNRMDQLSNLE
ncbi:AP-2 complex subunit sigma [Coemansia sp. RSA 1200]|nr:AP-2 complex subunit sigma [Coemansia sp. RSA 1200]